MGLKDRALLAALRLAPRHALTRLAGEAAGWARPAPLARLAVRGFARRYGLALDEAERPIGDYATVRELFTRKLRAGLRPVAAGASPVAAADGKIYELGETKNGLLVQAKGIDYTLAGLLADEGEARALQGGAYLAIYLSPRDYHRVHAPLGGEIVSWAYIPGDLWPVNPASVATVPGLFARNERLVTYLETPAGRCAVVMVGATVVGRLTASFWDPGQARPRGLRRERLAPGRSVEKGGELGIFDMGSTVICCFAPGRVRLDPELVPGAAVRMGQSVGEI